MRLDRAGEIDYYEELGVEPDASPDEIRDAFRALVRLLHPDHQQDENLKAIAEKQLRKLNRIYAVLSDADRRRRYDLAREGELQPPTAVVFRPGTRYNARELITRFIWICSAVIGVIMVIWLATDSPSPPAYSPERAGNSGTNGVPPVSARSPLAGDSTYVSSVQAAASDDEAHLRAELRAARSERDEAQRELEELKARQEAAAEPPPPAQTSAPAKTPAPLASSAPAPADPVPPRFAASPPVRPAAASSPDASPGSPPRSAKLPLSEAHQFAGFWFFSKAMQPNRNKNLYYPEFIEATLTEQNGSVHGRYRSRYQIVDRAISPDVNFEFSGTPSNGTMVCPWAGPGGAKGQLTLRMVDENDMKVDWTASDIGTVQGLASGTATLTRRLE